MPRYYVAEGFKGGTVAIRKPGTTMFIKIQLANATQAQLKFLKDNGHPAVLDEKPPKGKDE
jgi:hypothetical protein